MDCMFIDMTEEVCGKEKSHRLAEYIPDGRHMIEQDLFCRVASIWLIDRQTRIRLYPGPEVGYRGPE